VRNQRDRREGGPPGVAVSHGLTERGKRGPPGSDETIGITESRDCTTKAERRPQKQMSHQKVVLVLFFLVVEGDKCRTVTWLILDCLCRNRKRKEKFG
jgi:hypothetical protein